MPQGHLRALCGPSVGGGEKPQVRNLGLEPGLREEPAQPMRPEGDHATSSTHRPSPGLGAGPASPFPGCPKGEYVALFPDTCPKCTEYTVAAT